MKHLSASVLGLMGVMATTAIAGVATSAGASNPATSDCLTEPTAWDREVSVQHRDTQSHSVNTQSFVRVVKRRLAAHELLVFHGTLTSLSHSGATDNGPALTPESYEDQHEARRAWVDGGYVYVYVENRKAPGVTRGLVIQRSVITWDEDDVRYDDLCHSRPERYVIEIDGELKTEGVISAKVPWASNSSGLVNILTVIGTY